jgi:hypothetical protein
MKLSFDDEFTEQLYKFTAVIGCDEEAGDRDGRWIGMFLFCEDEVSGIFRAAVIRQNIAGMVTSDLFTDTKTAVEFFNQKKLLLEDAERISPAESWVKRMAGILDCAAEDQSIQ